MSDSDFRLFDVCMRSSDFLLASFLQSRMVGWLHSRFGIGMRGTVTVLGSARHGKASDSKRGLVSCMILQKESCAKLHLSYPFPGRVCLA